MIKKLKLKFIAIIMAIGSLVLLGTLWSNYYSSLANLRGQAETALEELALSGESKLESPWNLDKLSIPFFVIDVRPLGTLYATRSEYYTLTEQDILLVSTTVLRQASHSGTLPSLNLRYYVLELEDGVRIVCSDLSTETQIQKALLQNSVVTFLGALIMLFGLAILLTDAMISPVEQAWIRQQQFVADASHELKTPLTVILSSAEMLSAQQTESENTKRWLDNIDAEGRRMRRLIEDMLTLTNWDENESILTSIDLSATVNRVVLTFEPLFFEGKRMIDDEVTNNLVVLGDGDKLHQLVSILLDNSLKYSPENGVISVTLVRESARNALLKVSNLGEFIPHGQRERLFDRFYRRDKSRSGRRSGYGLGLSIAQQITALHHGKIWVECEGGQVCFLVRLPLEVKSNLKKNQISTP